MVKISEKKHKRNEGTISSMRTSRLPWWNHWRELANNYLPKRYIWLLSDTEARDRTSKNKFILDPTGTTAAKTLASGMMNGITSPSRVWFKLRVPHMEDEDNGELRIWLDEVERRMMVIMSESNFYNSLAVLYLDLVVFGTAAMLIYEDFDSVVRCYNPALGEYYLAQDDRLMVNTFAREFTYKVHQVVDAWGIENVSARVSTAYKTGGARMQENVDVVHLIEPNTVQDPSIPKKFKYREYYWEKAVSTGEILKAKGFNELPGVFARWSTVANDVYGTSPAMDMLGDTIQLQHETKNKAQAIDKMVKPPLIVDAQLQNKPNAFFSNGITYISNLRDNVGAKPVYQLNPPILEMSQDIRDIQARIREGFHNDLFRMISQLDTVRSSNEIDALREEKLVLLGPVLERFENEALDPGIARFFSIMERKQLLPPPPAGFEDMEIDVQYVSILSVAQQALSTIPTERFLAFLGNILQLYPPGANIPNFDELIRNFAKDIGVPTKSINTKNQSQKLDAAAAEQQQAQEAANVGGVLVDGAEQLSNVDVGGGQNALQQLIGG